MSIITGEQFQLMSDISFCTTVDGIKTDQLKTISQNLQIIPNFDQKEIKKYRKIFIYTDFIADFMNRFGDYLCDGTTIITHNSDLGIDSSYISFIDNLKIKKWYCQNRYIDHPKLSSIPIGIANSQWQHGNQNLISKIKNENNEKKYLVYKNFEIGTNPVKREICNQITNINGIPMTYKLDNENYWRMISKSVFTITPPGNGVDCHRIWESLYLGTVPIVEDHECFSQFKHLPILFIKDWNTITIPFLKDAFNQYKDSFKKPINELYKDYWQALINN
jgi:hypothetical protein